MDKQADAEVAQNLIRWLSKRGANIYSDRIAIGNQIAPRETLSDRTRAGDIFSPQLCLLPTPRKDVIEHVIVGGSSLLCQYASSAYYQEQYAAQLTAAYQSNHPAEAFRAYIGSQVQDKAFHHVLTELAFLSIRINEVPEAHGIIPVLLNGTAEESFPRFIMDSTTVRIEEMKWRAAGYWKGQPTYLNQGLHQGFFKLLKRVWVGQERTIQILEEGVYEDGIHTLRKANPPQSIEEWTVCVEQAVLRALKQLKQESQSALRILHTQELPAKIINRLHALEKNWQDLRLTRIRCARLYTR